MGDGSTRPRASEPVTVTVLDVHGSEGDEAEYILKVAVELVVGVVGDGVGVGPVGDGPDEDEGEDDGPHDSASARAADRAAVARGFMMERAGTHTRPRAGGSSAAAGRRARMTHPPAGVAAPGSLARGAVMTKKTTRRDVLRGSLALAGLSVVPEWALPALAQDETVVPFLDFPPTFNPNPAPDRRLLDVRTIASAFTPASQFFTTQHYGHPEVDPAAYRLKVSGLVKTPLELSLDDLRKLGATDLVAGFECSGNRRPLQGLVGNGRWTGVPLRAVLDRAGLLANAREIVCLGADRGPEEVEFRAQKFPVEQQYGRSLARDRALGPEAFLAWALNGEPLSRHQGAPLRLIVGGWYAMANVKWLSGLHAQEDQYLGKFQARWYRTLKSETIAGEAKWVETAITRQHLKSFIARVTRAGSAHKVTVVVLTDGTPVKTVEVRVDDGPWRAATADSSTTAKYGWKLYHFQWSDAAPGEHTIVSRVIDATGAVQPTEEELAGKKTFLEDNSQHPRRVTI